MKDVRHCLLSLLSTSEENEEDVPMSRSFSVEDLLDEVEKICYDASGAKVRDNRKIFFTLHNLHYFN